MDDNKTENGSSRSWWLENSHNRSHQSQWLQSTLSDLEKKVKKILSLIEDDGDTFAKRAEMFYKNRPLLIESVEDLQGSYISLAEKYDRLMFKSEHLRVYSNSGSPISENPEKWQGSSQCHDHNPNVDFEGQSLTPESQIDKSKKNIQDSDHGHNQNPNTDFEGSALGSQTKKSKIRVVDYFVDECETDWNELRANVMTLIHDNLEQQVELVKRNDEKREAINELRIQISKLFAENTELKSKLVHTKADIKRNKSQLSRAKDVIFKRFLP